MALTSGRATVFHCFKSWKNSTKLQNYCTFSRKLVKVSIPQATTLQRARYSNRPPLTHVTTKEAARLLVLGLDDRGRSLLKDELQKFEKETKEEEDSGVKEVHVTAAELWDVFMFNCLPFVGFGFLDNFIMIVAGEYIDATLGAALGISTMAAAALGNLVSDVAGVGSAGYIEILASKVGMRTPHITPAQAHLQGVRWSVALGRALGISIGCFLGMVPLLFFPNKRESEDDEETQESTESKSTQSPDSLTSNPSLVLQTKGSTS